MFEEMDVLMLSYIDKPNLFGHWIYNHWNNIMYFFKLGFVAEDNIRPTTSRNKAERIKRDWGIPVGYKTLRDEFTIAVDAVEFQKMLETLAKGDLRSLGFEQNKSFDIPSDSERSVITPRKKPQKKVKTRPPPSPPGGGSDDDRSSGDDNRPGGDDPSCGREKSPGQQSWERTTGILSEPDRKSNV